MGRYAGNSATRAWILGMALGLSGCSGSGAGEADDDLADGFDASSPEDMGAPNEGGNAGGSSPDGQPNPDAGAGAMGGSGGFGGAAGSGGTSADAREPDVGADGPPDASPDVMDAMPEETPPEGWGVPIGNEIPFGACNARMQAYTTEGAVHVELCSDINYKSNPPHSGNHYPAWAAYRTYSRPIPWGFLVHSLEHGAVVITYNCPQGCAEELAQVQTFINALPADCGGGVKRRVIVMPEPKLPVKFAASAWRHTLKADCFDRAAFQRFFDERYNKGREDSCNQGTDPTGESNGRTPLCGL